MMLYQRKLPVLLLFCAMLYAGVLLQPALHLKLGNIFFGDVPALYNVHLSQYFFAYAADPLIGETAPYAHYQLSRTFFITGNFDAAVIAAKQELALFPEHVRTYYILGLTYGYMNKEEEAIEAFSKFIEAYPNSWAARNDKAWLQFRIGQVAAAYDTLQPVADVYNPWVQNTKGTLLFNMQKHSEAKEAFLIAEEITRAMTPEEWGNAYPGNDPRIYETGLSAMQASIASNLKLIANQQSHLSPVE